MINQTAQPPAWLKVLYFVQILYPAIYGIQKFIAIIRQLRARIPQTAIGGKPQRSQNQEINANASDLRAFVVLRFRVGLYVPGAFAANTRIPAQAAGIESRGMLTPAACRPHGVHFLPEGEKRPPSPGAGIRPDALPSLSPSDALSRKRPLCPQIFTYSGFLLSGVQLHARTRSARLRESVSIWRALSAVLFPSGISGRPGAAVMVRLLIVRKERDAPGSPARGIDRGETAAQVLSLCPSVCTIRDELPRLYSYSPETPARVCERLRVFCGVPSCRSCREERKPRRQALSRPHCLNPRAPRLCPQLHACEPVRSRGYVCIL